MSLCVLLWVLEEVPANWSTKKTWEGGRGLLFRNHGNQTRSLHKLCSFFFFFFFDLVKAGVCINVPTFPYQRCFETLLSCGLIIYFIAVLWLASSPGPALAEIPSTTCWQPGRDASPTRSEEGQSSQASIASIFLSLHSPRTWLSASPEQSLSVVFTPGLSTSQCALAVETWGGRQSSRKLRCMDLILAWSSTWTTNQPVCFSSISYTPPTSPSHGHNLFLSFP